MNILFICTGNTCRSPMAEGMLKSVAEEKGLNLIVNSRGLFAKGGSPAADNAIASMRDIGIDISEHVSKGVSKEIIEDSDLILTMTSAHKDELIRAYPEKKYKIFLLNEYAFGTEVDINDPYGMDVGAYYMARDEIMYALKKIYKHIEDK